MRSTRKALERLRLYASVPEALLVEDDPEWAFQIVKHWLKRRKRRLPSEGEAWKAFNRIVKKEAFEALQVALAADEEKGDP